MHFYLQTEVNPKITGFFKVEKLQRSNNKLNKTRMRITKDKFEKKMDNFFHDPPSVQNSFNKLDNCVWQTFCWHKWKKENFITAGSFDLKKRNILNIKKPQIIERVQLFKTGSYHFTKRVIKIKFLLRTSIHWKEDRSCNENLKGNHHHDCFDATQFS